MNSSNSAPIVILKGKGTPSHACMAIYDTLFLRAGRMVMVVDEKKLELLKRGKNGMVADKAIYIIMDIRAGNLPDFLLTQPHIKKIFIHTASGLSMNKQSITEENASYGHVFIEGCHIKGPVAHNILLPCAEPGSWDKLNPFSRTGGLSWVAMLSQEVPHETCRNIHREFINSRKRNFILGIFEPAKETRELATRFENLHGYFQPATVQGSWSCELSGALMAGLPVFAESPPLELKGFVSPGSLEEIEAMLPLWEYNAPYASVIKKITQDAFLEKILPCISQA